MASRPSIGLVVLAVVCIVATAGVIAQSGYAISSPDSSAMPERSVEFQGESQTIDSRIAVAPGDEITVDVTAPDEVYRVYVYNGDRQIVDRERGDGSGSFTFDLSGYEPGSYVVTAQSRESDQHEAIMPLLVEGYDVGSDAPSTVGADESFDVTVDVSATAASGDPASVSAVLVGDEEDHRIDATGGDGEYTASVSAGELPAGEYTVYAAVQGSGEAFGEDELLGAAEGGTVTVNEADESSDGDGATGGGGGGVPADDGTDTATPAGNGTATPTDNGTAAPTDDGNATATPEESTETPTDEGGTADATPTEAVTETPTDEGGAITPNEDDGTTATTTDASGPGFGPLSLLIAVCALLGLAGLRTRA